MRSTLPVFYITLYNFSVFYIAHSDFSVLCVAYYGFLLVVYIVNYSLISIIVHTAFSVFHIPPFDFSAMYETNVKEGAIAKYNETVQAEGPSKKYVICQ